MAKKVRANALARAVVKVLSLALGYD